MMFSFHFISFHYTLSACFFLLETYPTDRIFIFDELMMFVSLYLSILWWEFEFWWDYNTCVQNTYEPTTTLLGLKFSCITMVPNGQNYKNLKTLENHFYIFIEASNWQSHLEIVLRKGHFLFSFSMFLQILMVYYTDRDLLDSSLLIQENATV